MRKSGLPSIALICTGSYVRRSKGHLGPSMEWVHGLVLRCGLLCERGGRGYGLFPAVSLHCNS